MFRTLIFILLFALSGCSAIAELETKTEAKEAKKKALEFLVGKGIDDIMPKTPGEKKKRCMTGKMSGAGNSKGINRRRCQC